MNQREAFRDSLKLYEERATRFHVADAGEGCSLGHARSMMERIDANPDQFSPSKLGRWLGWLQGVMCAYGLLTLEEAKQINKRWSGE